MTRPRASHLRVLSIAAILLACLTPPPISAQPHVTVPPPTHTPAFEIQPPQGLHERSGKPLDLEALHELKNTTNSWVQGFPILQQRHDILTLQYFNTPRTYMKLEYGRRVEVRDCIFTEPTYTPLLARCGDSWGEPHVNERIIERCEFNGWSGPHLLNFDRVGNPQTGSGCSLAEIRDIRCLELCSNGTTHDVKGISMDCSEAVGGSKVIIERVWFRSPRELRGRGNVMPLEIEGAYSDAVYLIGIYKADEVTIQDCLLEGSTGSAIVINKVRKKVVLRNIELHDVAQAAPFPKVWGARFAVDPIYIACSAEAEIICENITLDGEPYEPTIRRSAAPRQPPEE